MNLHAAVAGAVSAINPQLRVGLRSSTGYTTNASHKQVPSYAAPGVLVGSIAGSVLTVSAVSVGKLQAGQSLLGAGVQTSTKIVSGPSNGGPGAYVVDPPQTVASVSMTTLLSVLAQVQPLTWRDLQQLDGLNVQGTKQAMYVNGTVDGVIRVTAKGGDLVVLPDNSVWLVVQVLEGWGMTSGWTKVAIVLQNGE